MHNVHHFHIPVMGTGFTIDTPLRVAPLGISSVISLVDDQLIERMYKHHAEASGIPYKEIRRSEHHARPRRITRYLDLLKDLVEARFEEIKKQDFSPHSELTKYFELLSNDSSLRMEYEALQKEAESSASEIKQDELRNKMTIGSVDVNIMTKLDRALYRNGRIVESELSDAAAALKGFAESSLSSAVVFSAGVNAKLFQAVSTYDDFFPSIGASPRKRIVLKVSDFRSALTQGKMLAKKGVWVSEFRVESGLNCGGHAFPTKGELMAVTLYEFVSRREELIETIFKPYAAAIEKKCGLAPASPPEVRFSAQGGVGTSDEQELLRNRFRLDSIGWGTPFLLVPEVTRVDEETRAELMRAKSSDVLLSDSSPLGVPFYTLKNSKSELMRKRKVEENRPGSPCFNKYLAANTEFGGEPLCVASRTYQKKKLAELELSDLPTEEVERQKAAVLRKACICFDLGAAPRMGGNSEVRETELHTAVCPGPNIAYLDRCYSLCEMVDHIYGRPSPVRWDNHRPHFLIKEAMLYIDYLQSQFTEGSDEKLKGLDTFRENLHAGLVYYKELALELDNGSEAEGQAFLRACELITEQLAGEMGTLRPSNTPPLLE